MACTNDYLVAQVLQNDLMTAFIAQTCALAELLVQEIGIHAAEKDKETRNTSATVG